MKFVDRVYIISMHKNGIRRQNLYNDLLSAGFGNDKIEWVHAIDGSQLDIDELLDENKVSFKFIDPNGALTKSIYGCALSHQLAYEKFLKTDDTIKTALILEDDAALTHTALRNLISGSRGYGMLVDDVEKINWGVIQVGSWSQKIEGKECCDAFVLNHMERYPSGYAAHSYIINKPSAQKLIDNNKPIQYAADVNIHCSDIELYSTPISHFGQKTGDYFRWDTAKMTLQFEEHILFEMEKHGNEFLSHTTHGDDYYTEDGCRNIKTASITSEFDIEKITFEPFMNSYGDVIKNWATIYLRTKDYE
jgi:GR25 family glycosyltransferase involved in LPS biosynthesis